MKRFLLLFLIPLFFACDDSGSKYRNPNIPNVTFTVTIDTNLPAYSQLNFPGNGVYLPNYGVAGVWVFSTGSGYNAFDAACPNQPITSCSTMSLTGGNLVCPCDDVEYSLFTGQAMGEVNVEYDMKPYRVQVSGTSIRIYN